MSTLLFIIFAGMAIGCAIAMVSQSNPLYSAISLSRIHFLLNLRDAGRAFIAAVQVIVYAARLWCW